MARLTRQYPHSSIVCVLIGYVSDTKLKQKIMISLSNNILIENTGMPQITRIPEYPKFDKSNVPCREFQMIYHSQNKQTNMTPDVATSGRFTVFQLL